jgi:succinate-acetate transporter protein
MGALGDGWFPVGRCGASVGGSTASRRPLDDGAVSKGAPMTHVTTQRDDAVSTPATVSAGIADPGPLGLAGFAATTFFLSAVNAGLLPKTVEGAVFGLAIFYGGIGQLLAGMWEFTKGNTFGALAFSSYGAFWLSFWYLVTHLPKASASDLNKAIGTYLLIWTIFTVYMFVASMRTSGAIMAVFLLLALTFLFLMLGAYGGSAGLTKLGGWLGLATAVVAWYTSLAGVFNATAKRAVLPTMPRA